MRRPHPSVTHKSAHGTPSIAGEADPAAGPLPQHPGRRQVIGVDMRLHGTGKTEAEGAQDTEVALDHLGDRIQQDGFRRLRTAEQVRVGRRAGVEQLTKDHPLTRG